jgi:hypothetical protein
VVGNRAAAVRDHEPQRREPPGKSFSPTQAKFNITDYQTTASTPPWN